MMTGPASRVERTRARGGVRRRPSGMTRVNRRSRKAPRAPRLDDPGHAGTSAALVTAGLERTVQRGAPGMWTGFRQRPDLGMRLARPLVIALAHNHAGRRHDDGADERIRTRPAATARGV